MKYILSILAFSVFLLAGGCTPAAFNYAQARNPECKVTLLKSVGASVVVEIQCPGQDTRIETFTER